MSELDRLVKNEADYRSTTVEEGTQFKGALHSSCPVTVRGVVDGELFAPSLIVAETGTVTGNVKVQTIQSSGTLAGRIEADDIQLSGSVRSDTVIRAKTMEVKLQSSHAKRLEVTFGECMLEVGDDPGVLDAMPLPKAVAPVNSASHAAASKKAARRTEVAQVAQVAQVPQADPVATEPRPASPANEENRPIS
jgi:cytoskeletal protein CcmA (bactofilin family)